MRPARRRPPGHLLVLGLTLLAGCAGVGPPPAATPTPTGNNGGDDTFERIQREIFDGNCLTAGCHNSQSRSGNLDLSAGNSYAQLVDRVPDNETARVAGLLRVDSTRPDNSFLLVKLTAPGAGEGGRMPLDSPALAPAQLDRIREWIVSGAPSGAAPSATPTPTPTPTLVP